MRFDINRIVVTTILTLTSVTLISGVVTASTIEPDKISAFRSPYFQTAPWIGKNSDNSSGNKFPLNGATGKLLEPCPDCAASDTNQDEATAPVTKSLSFVAAADPQINTNTYHPRVAFQNDIARYLLGKVYDDDSYKGLIIAGDLTEHTYKQEILDVYNSVLGKEDTELNTVIKRGKELDRLYEGLGNHDMMKGTCCAGENAGEKCVCESGLTEIIGRGDRRDQLRSQPPHYSWEWEGIRFVQLNLLPADEAETVWNGSSRDPKDALTFLKEELEDAGPDKNVIIIHHYGMDRFSRKWWSIETKNTYEEVISDYRVVAIITGHLHWSRRRANMQQCWNGVTAVTVGSLRLGFTLDFKIDNDYLTVTRLRNGSEGWSDSYPIGHGDSVFCGDNT